jgi:hypothetical protein
MVFINIWDPHFSSIKKEFLIFGVGERCFSTLYMVQNITTLFIKTLQNFVYKHHSFEKCIKSIRGKKKGEFKGRQVCTN